MEELLISPLSCFFSFATNRYGYSGTTQELIVKCVHTLFLKNEAEASRADNPNWLEVMKSSFADKCLKTAINEIVTLEKMGVWNAVDDKGANVSDLNWAFKIKSYPDELIKKFMY